MSLIINETPNLFITKKTFEDSFQRFDLINKRESILGRLILINNCTPTEANYLINLIVF